MLRIGLGISSYQRTRRENTAPENVVAPSITGTPTFGEIQTLVPGTWKGTPTPSISRQWQKSSDGIAWENISGETGTTYTISIDDFYHYIRVIETATNDLGTVSQESNVVGVDDEELSTDFFVALHLHDGYGDTTGRLFQDNARTIPAVNDGDPVASIVDPQSEFYTQVVLEAQRPILRKTLDGIPYLEWDGSKLMYLAPNSSTYQYWNNKRGSFYLSHMVNKNHVITLLLNTVQGGTPPTFYLPSSPLIVYSSGFFYSAKYFSESFSYVLDHQDWGWQTQSLVRKTDNAMDFYVDNSLKMADLPCVNNQPAANVLWIGQTFKGYTGSIVYSDSGSYQPIIDRIVTARSPKMTDVGYTTQLTFDGDSITAGGSVTTAGGSYPDIAMTSLNDSTVIHRNMAIGGTTLTQQYSWIQRIKNSFLPDVEKIVCIMSGSNDLYFGSTVEDLKTLIQNYVNSIKTWDSNTKVIASTILPREGAGTPETFEDDRNEYNEWLKDNYQSIGIDALANFGDISELQDPSDTTYYIDLIHPNAAGNQFLATEFLNAYNSL